MPEKPRQDRSVRTRERLLDAAVESLVRHGHAGTTMQRVQAAAGVSRGTLTHHFPSMQALLVAAVQHVAAGQLAELRALLAVHPAPDHDVPALLHRAMSGPLFLAGLELWVAARTDPVLRDALVPAERRLGQALRAVVTGDAGPGGDDAAAREDLAGLLALLRGLALTSVLREDPELDARIVARWRRS